MAYAATSRFEELENANASIQKENKELRAILAAHAGQIERNKQTIYLYAGGFYNRRERQLFEDHLDNMEDQSLDDNSLEDELESIFPKTRQVILNDRRLTELEGKFKAHEVALEEQLAVLEENLTQIFKERDEQLTEFETRLKELEIKINAMEERQRERMDL
jgi:hypothetical protein